VNLSTIHRIPIGAIERPVLVLSSGVWRGNRRRELFGLAGVRCRECDQKVKHLFNAEDQAAVRDHEQYPDYARRDIETE